MSDTEAETPAPVADDATVQTPAAEAGKPTPARNNKLWMGTAVGVGSAALVAALMYASRRPKKK